MPSSIRLISYAALFAALVLGVVACSSPATDSKPNAQTDKKPKDQTDPKTKDQSDSKPTDTPAQPMKITAEELTKIFKDDFDAAAKKYPEKTIMEVTGVIEDPLSDNGTVISLEGYGKQPGTASSPVRVNCEFERGSPSLKVLAPLKQGQKVTVKGSFWAAKSAVTNLGFVRLKECELIDPKP